MALTPRPYERDPAAMASSAMGQGMDWWSHVTPYVKYIHDDERDRFMELSQQMQSRELLLQNLEVVGGMGAPSIIKGVGQRAISPIFRKLFPKTSKGIDDIGEAYTGPKMGDATPDPKYAGSINTEKQLLPIHLKLAEQRVDDMGWFTKSPSVKWTDVDAKSAKILQDPEALGKVFEKNKKGMKLSVVEEDVFRKANIDGVYKFQRDIDAAKTVEEAQQIHQKYVDELFAPTSEIARGHGQALNLHKKQVGLHRLGSAFAKLGRNLNQREMNALIDLDLNNPAAVKQYMNELGDPKLMDYVYEYWYNSILSGVPTHVVNIASNTAWRMFQAPHRALTGVVDKAINPIIKVWKPGRQRTRFVEETIPLMGGFIKGKPRAAGRAWNMMKKGKITEFETKWAQEMGTSIGAFGRSNSPAVRGVGQVLTIPTKALRTMDVYANSIAYDGQMQALAKRAWIQGKKKGDFKPFMEKFVKDPPEWAHDEAMEFFQPGGLLFLLSIRLGIY
jgi:hypothetical protein